MTTSGRTQLFLPEHQDADISSEFIDVFIRTFGDTIDSLTLTKPGAIVNAAR